MTETEVQPEEVGGREKKKTQEQQHSSPCLQSQHLREEAFGLRGVLSASRPLCGVQSQGSCWNLTQPQKVRRLLASRACLFVRGPNHHPQALGLPLPADQPGLQAPRPRNQGCGQGWPSGALPASQQGQWGRAQDPPDSRPCFRATRVLGGPLRLPPPRRGSAPHPQPRGRGGLGVLPLILFQPPLRSLPGPVAAWPQASSRSPRRARGGAGEPREEKAPRAPSRVRGTQLTGASRADGVQRGRAAELRFISAQAGRPAAPKPGGYKFPC